MAGPWPASYRHQMFLPTTPFMSLEKTLHTRFRCDRHRALVNVMFTAHWISGLHAPIFKQFGLSSQQYNILRILRGRHPEPASIGQIKERMLERESDVSRVVSHMLSKGFVRRFECAKDRRVAYVAITEQGMQLLAQIDPQIEQIDSMLDCLTQEQIEQLNQVLDTLREANTPEGEAPMDIEEACPRAAQQAQEAEAAARKSA